MGITRRFVIAPAFARLIRRDRGAKRILEGHFEPSRDRQSHVMIDGKCHLILVTRGPTGEMEEEPTEVSLRQAHFLLDVCAGTIIYERTRLDTDGPELCIDCYSRPDRLALAEVDFETEPAAGAFQVPVWFGPEVTGEPGYDRCSIAINNAPIVPDTPISEDSLNGLLDLLDRVDRDRASSSVEPIGFSSRAEPLNAAVSVTEAGDQVGAERTDRLRAHRAAHQG